MDETIEIMVFGQLADITGRSAITIGSAGNTDALLEKLFEVYPVLKEKKFLLAVDQQIISGNTFINQRTRVALLPPYSGG